MKISTSDIKSTTIEGAIEELKQMDIDFDYYANQFRCGTADLIEGIAQHIVLLDMDYTLELYEDSYIVE